MIGLPTSLPGVQSLNKDQYRATLDVNQLVYNGGIIDANAKKLKEAQTKTQQQLIEVSLYQIKTRISQYFFSILFSRKKHYYLQKELLISKVKGN